MAKMQMNLSTKDLAALVEELGVDSWYYSEARTNLNKALEPVVLEANPDEYEEIVADKDRMSYLCIYGVIRLFVKYGHSIRMVYTRLTEMGCDLSGYTYDGFYQLVCGAFICGLMEEYNQEILKEETDLTFIKWLQRND